MRVVTLTREELHRRVWAAPLRTVAAEIGISDVGLSKACKRHNIPLPKQGYWLRKEANRHKTPLPASDGNDDPVSLVFEESEFKSKIRAAQRLTVAQITVPEDLTDAHPLVEATVRAAKGMRFDEAHGKQSLNINEKHLDVRVSPNQFDRTLRICSGLIYACESIGAEWIIDGKYATWILYQSQRIHVCLIEKMRRVPWPHEPVVQQRRAAKGEPNWDALLPRSKLVGTGLVEFKILSHMGAGIQSHWGGNKRQLEGELSSIVASIPIAAAAIKARDEQFRAQALERQQKRQARIDVAKEAEIAKLLRERLAQAARSWQDATTIRAYCTAVEQHFREADLHVDDRQNLDLWLSWAKREAESIDPIGRGLAEVVDYRVDLPSDFDGKVTHPLWGE